MYINGSEFWVQVNMGSGYGEYDDDDDGSQTSSDLGCWSHPNLKRFLPEKEV